MILIADSGSTKTGWALLSKNKSPHIFHSPGCNPYHCSPEEMLGIFQKHFPKEYDCNAIHEVYFFGAGCGLPEKQMFVSSILKRAFPLCTPHVKSDMMGAGLALFGKHSGIACVIGTGSNAVLWDGEKTEIIIPSLGYILGDEGSGAWIGKKFLAALLRGEFETHETEYFRLKINLSDAEILDAIYTSSHSKQFLASMIPILASKIDSIQVRNMIRQAFDSFLQTFVLPIPGFSEYQIGFCGSVAYYLQDILHEAANAHQIRATKILQDPLNGLIDYFNLQ